MSMLIPGYKRIVTICLLLAWPGASARGQGSEIKSGPATLRIEGVRQDSDRLTARLSARIVLTVQIEGGKTLKVEPTKLLADSTDWEVTQVKEPSEKKTWQESFVLQPVKPGALNVPLRPLRYRDNQTSPWQVVKWPAVVINVTTEILNPDPNELYDRLEPESPPSTPLWWRGSVLPFLAAALAVSLAGMWFLHRKGKTKTIPAPDALAELDSIGRLPLESPEQIEHFHSLLSEVFRTFLQRALNLPVTKRTTEELLAEMQEGHPYRKRIAEIVKRCDLVKFARTCPDADACHALADAVRALISELSLDVPQDRAGQQKNGPVG